MNQSMKRLGRLQRAHHMSSQKRQLTTSPQSHRNNIMSQQSTMNLLRDNIMSQQKQHPKTKVNPTQTVVNTTIDITLGPEPKHEAPKPAQPHQEPPKHAEPPKPHQEPAKHEAPKSPPKENHNAAPAPHANPAPQHHNNTAPHNSSPPKSGNGGSHHGR
jgi:hypothetical protein